MPGQVYLPSVICYEQVATDEWRDHFCLVNPTQCFDSEDEASAMAGKDLNHAAAMKSASGSDADFAMSLKNKGYVNVEGFQRAVDNNIPTTKQVAERKGGSIDHEMRNMS
jgi:hypothetical protein